MTPSGSGAHAAIAAPALAPLAPTRRQPRSPYSHRTHTLLRGLVEPKQYVSFDYRQTLGDHRVLGSIGSVGDAYDNAMCESFVDSVKTELINDRVFKTRSQLELAILEYVAWFNNDWLHESLGDRPPAEVEAEWAALNRPGFEPLPALRPSPTRSTSPVVYDPFGVVSDLQYVTSQPI